MAKIQSRLMRGTIVHQRRLCGLWGWLSMVIIFWGVLLPNVSWAWGRAGHEAICEIAWQRLTPAAHRLIRQWLKPSGYTRFYQACNWPDQIRSQPEWKWTTPYHFINVPKTAIQVNKARDCAHGACVLGGIAQYIKQLQHPQQLTAQQKWQALVFLAHYIGDVHQPLHVSYANDHGGNGRIVLFQDQKYSLHHLWDSYLIKRIWPHQGGRHIGQALNRQISPIEAKRWQRSLDAADWANESLSITRSLYRHSETERYDQAYLNRYKPIITQRLQQAGVRLAFQLQNLLDKQEDVVPVK